MTPAEPSATLLAALERAGEREDVGLRLLDRREEGSFLNWAAIRERAAAVAGGLQALGIRPGERVALVYPTCAGFFDAFFGTLLAGGVPTPLYPPVRFGRRDEYHRRSAAMIERSGARLVLAEGRVRRLLGETMELCRATLGCLTLDELPAGAAAPPAVAPGDLALVQFSSGTTDDPKPVALSHRAVMSQVLLLNALWPDRDGLRHSGVSWLPLYHDMGLIGCVLAALERPADLTLIPPELFVARPASWLRAISRYRATVSPAPNFAYRLCVDKIEDGELEGVDLSSWRAALDGAEAVTPSVLRAFIRRFEPYGFRAEALTPVYGLSEASLGVTFSDLESRFTARRFDRDGLSGEGRAVESPAGLEIVSNGRPLAGFELSLRSESGEELPEGRVGRLWVRGPSLMEGYLGDPESTSRALVEGWLDTGDLGFLHRGELFLTGRAKDAIILRGRNHAPETLERAVAGLPGTAGGCAAAMAHLPEGAEREELLLFVERTREATPEEAAALPEACRREVLAQTGLAVDRVLVLEPGALPRTSSGKIRRRETLLRHLAGGLSPNGSERVPENRPERPAAAARGGE